MFVFVSFANNKLEDELATTVFFLHSKFFFFKKLDMTKAANHSMIFL